MTVNPTHRTQSPTRPGRGDAGPHARPAGPSRSAQRTAHDELTSGIQHAVRRTQCEVLSTSFAALSAQHVVWSPSTTVPKAPHGRPGGALSHELRGVACRRPWYRYEIRSTCRRLVPGLVLAGPVGARGAWACLSKCSGCGSPRQPLAILLWLHFSEALPRQSALAMDLRGNRSQSYSGGTSQGHCLVVFSILESEWPAV